MREIGVQVEIPINKNSKSIYSVYFYPLSYLDWSYYSESGIPSSGVYDPASLRYIFSKYISRASKSISDDGNISSTEEVPAVSLVDLPADASVGIVNRMFSSSIYSNPEDMSELVNRLEKSSRTLPGTYDMFILMQTGNYDLYLRALEMEESQRVQLIMALEKMSGIVVSERFNDSIELNIPIDLVNSNNKYKSGLKGKEKPDRQQMKVPKPAGTVTRDDIDQSVLERISNTRSALDIALGKRNDVKGVKPSFDWGRDNMEYDGFSKDDRDALNKDIRNR